MDLFGELGLFGLLYASGLTSFLIEIGVIDGVA
mgnify:CR=1 FL=1|jgi:hypothetical protein